MGVHLLMCNHTPKAAIISFSCSLLDIDAVLIYFFFVLWCHLKKNKKKKRYFGQDDNQKTKQIHREKLLSRQQNHTEIFHTHHHNPEQSTNSVCVFASQVSSSLHPIEETPS